MVDLDAVNDRLLAEFFGASLRDRGLFSRATTLVDDDQVDLYVRERGNAICDDLLIRKSSEVDLAVARAKAESESVWLDSAKCDAGPKRIVSELSWNAKRMLQHDGYEMTLCVNPGEPGREILRWRYLTLALPPGILMAAGTPRKVRPATAVRLLHDSIGPDSPVAHHHVHHASVVSFEELWASLRLRALLRPNELAQSLRSDRAFCPRLHPGTCVADDRERADMISVARHMTEWGDLIRQAFIAGRVLDAHLDHAQPFAQCSKCGNSVRSTLSAFLAGRTKPFAEIPTSYPEAWSDELIGLRRDERDSAVVRGRGRDRSNGSSVRRQVARERRVLTEAFAYLRPEDLESPDPDYERLFVQYLRVKTALFGLIVHHPGEPGLTNFLRHFSQIKIYAPDAQELSPPEAIEPGLHVIAAEYRVAPDAWFDRLCRYELDIKRNSPAFPGRPQEFAWLVHFKRSPPDRGRPIHRASIQRMDMEVDRVAQVLEANPIYLRTLRGVDICGVEEDQPLWVSAESLMRMREHSRNICRRNPTLCLRPLHLTVHCGEDFRWLTSGVRAVAEPFYWKLIERGDRIGHGVALTLDPGNWWKDHEDDAPIPVKRFDRLLDLAFLAEYATPKTSGEKRWLRKEIKNVVKEIWLELPKVLSALDLVDEAKKLWRGIGGGLTRRMLEMEHASYSEAHDRWLHDYLWNKNTQKRANKPLDLQVGGWWRRVGPGQRNELRLLKRARGRLITEVARWQVCIESNPSSNLVIASLDSMTSQEFLQKRPTQAPREGEEPLTWSISTDNPITFSTTLADEYAYAWAGMVFRKKEPRDPSHARALLDEAAATSVRARFTIPNSERKP